MSDQKPATTIIVQNQNNGCGCGSGCGTLIGILVFIGMIGYALEENGPIISAAGGLFLGCWGGLKISGVTVDELNTGEWDKRKTKAIYFSLAGGFFGAVTGWQLGAEFIKELEDNKEAFLRLLNFNKAA